MLKGSDRVADLAGKASEIVDAARQDLEELADSHAGLDWEVLSEPVTEITFPVIEYPVKVQSFSLDKADTVSGVLQGIKGQYLIMDGGVINMRKFAGYEIGLYA